MTITMTRTDESSFQCRNESAIVQHPQPPNAYYKGYNLPSALFLVLPSTAATTAIGRSTFLKLEREKYTYF